MHVVSVDNSGSTIEKVDVAVVVAAEVIVVLW